MNQNNLHGGRESIGSGNYYRVIEHDTYQAEAEVARLQQETDARIAGRMAVGMTFFALGGGANLMPLTQAATLEAIVATTEVADNHKTNS